MKKKIFAVLSIILILCIATTSTAFAVSYGCDVEYGSDALMVVDLETEMPVFEHNSTNACYLAQLSNLMVFLVVEDEVKDLDNTKIKVTQEFLDRNGLMDETLSKLVGNKVSVKDLLYILILTDGADASLLLADYVTDGNKTKFVSLMNQKAKKIGCEDTNFISVSPTVSRDQYSNCYDIFKMFKYALKSETFSTIAKSSSNTFYFGDGFNDGVEVDSYNSIKRSSSPYYFSYVKESVYGYSGTTGQNIVSRGVYKDMNYIVIALGADKGDEINAYTDTKQMLIWAFTSLIDVKLLNAKAQVAQVYSDSPFGNDTIDLIVPDELHSIVPRNYDEIDINVEYKVPNMVELPIFKGQQIGKGIIRFKGKKIKEFGLSAAQSQGVSLLRDTSTIFTSMYKDVMKDDVVIADEITD